jgi:hypothetical protein
VAELCAGLPRKHLEQLLGIASLDRETEAPIGQVGKAYAHDVADKKSIRGGGGGRRWNCNTLMPGEILEPEARRSIALALIYSELV